VTAYVSPLGHPRTAGFALAARPALAGNVVGLLTNGKPNADKLLRNLGDALAATHGVGDVMWLDKTASADGPGFAAPDWMLELLSSGAVAVLTASGD
jgi:hypothetical protein